MYKCNLAMYKIFAIMHVPFMYNQCQTQWPSDTMNQIKFMNKSAYEAEKQIYFSILTQTKLLPFKLASHVTARIPFCQVPIVIYFKVF